ncbi:DUF4124 domain-containing protein [Verminephrobacter aporrectodeae subsp. tuberculatae]|uniref:DUF4124 domain-containing protein n=1 Tax=Verminephrobacter aporrectodeae TaxID=1110389 RepID=UPI002242F4CC|nr:DUF4124 domain-containing protein [Verminephrobacter aporrectodeae]MCW8163512.1 DUF4124 domain-containing protein [Verminephrobacter aporrectodeae subsp. tuberculatae]MCW8167767.1 DUF4124 domain-containing protein [Verminephrobacter aporrectodeae subsp. tuberculatae]
MGGALLAALGSACAQAQGASIYTCVDRNGNRLTADRLIADCLDREQRELGPSGIVRRQIGPSLSDQERAAQETQRRQEAEARTRALDERRREHGLIARYPNKAAHDVERAAAIQVLDNVTATAEEHIAELKQQRQALDAEMDSYRKNPEKAPVALRRRIAENAEGMTEQLRFVAGQEQEKQRVHQRFDAELVQLRRLWNAQPTAQGASSAEVAR